MTVDETPNANEIATIVADRCHGNRKPDQAPSRYAIIWQAARLGAIEAEKRNALQGIPDPAAVMAAFEAMRDALGELEASIERRWEGESDRKRANSVSPRTEDALEAARTALTLAKQVKP